MLEWLKNPVCLKERSLLAASELDLVAAAAEELCLPKVLSRGEWSEANQQSPSRVWFAGTLGGRRQTHPRPWGGTSKPSAAAGPH